MKKKKKKKKMIWIFLIFNQIWIGFEFINYLFNYKYNFLIILFLGIPFGLILSNFILFIFSFFFDLNYFQNILNIIFLLIINLIFLFKRKF